MPVTAATALKYVVWASVSCGATSEDTAETKTFKTKIEAIKYEKQIHKEPCFKDPIKGECCRYVNAIEEESLEPIFFENGQAVDLQKQKNK